jgi:hypothetical protein
LVEYTPKPEEVSEEVRLNSLSDDELRKILREKFYSLKPRVSIGIYYQNTFDSSFNQKRTVKSKKFKSLNLPEEIIETFPF